MSSLANHDKLADRDPGGAEPQGPPARKPNGSPEGVRTETLWQIAKNVITRIGRDNLMLVAAGVAFYAMTAIFPAIAAFVSIYGLFADPSAVQTQIAQYGSLIPEGSLKLLTDALQSFASKSNSSLNLALFVSLALAVWSAKAGVASLMTGLNITNETIEKRGFLLQQLVGLALTVGALIFAIVAFSAIALLPAVIAFFPLSDGIKITLGCRPIKMLA